MRAVRAVISAHAFAVLPLLVLPAHAQDSAASASNPVHAARPPLLALPAHLLLALPQLSAFTSDAPQSWLTVPLELQLSASFVATLTPTAPMRTADDGEVATYTARLPLAQLGRFAAFARHDVAPKLELDCRGTCQPEVEHSASIEARFLVVGTRSEPDAALFLRHDFVASRPSTEQRLRLGVTGQF